MADVEQIGESGLAADGGCAHPGSLFGFWAIEPQQFQQFVALAKGANLTELRQEARELREKAAASGTERALYARTNDGIAVIEVRGPMTKYETSFQSFLGGTSTLRTRQALRAAVRDPETVGIMLVFDSPGGSVDGTADLADDIEAASKRKPTYAYAEDLMASAAVFAGVRASKVLAGKAARVGAIGAYAVLHDTSGVYAQDGVKVHVISSAPPHKGAGVPGTELSAEQLAEFKRQVTERAAVLVEGALVGGRRMSKEKADSLHTGQVWEASKAKELGLIDDVVSLDEAMRLLRSEAMQKQDEKAALALAEEAESKLNAEKAAHKATTDELATAKARIAEFEGAKAKEADPLAGLPAEARAKVEAAEQKNTELAARIAKLEAEDRKKTFGALAKDLALPADFAAHLDKIEASVPAETWTATVERFKAVKAQVAKVVASDGKPLDAEIGSTGGGEPAATAFDQAQARAKALVKEGKAKTEHEGLDLAWKEDPALYKRHMQERRRAS